MALLQEPVPIGNLPTAPDIMSLPIWDASALDRQVGKNLSLQRRLLLKFLTNASLQVADMVDVDAKNLAKVAKKAHVLKSNARSVGAMQLGELCQLLENAGFASDGLTCNALAPKLVAALAQASAAIQESLG